jgi:hypothetical protein
MKYATTVLSIGLLLSGCTVNVDRYQWTWPAGKFTQAALQADKNDCIKSANQAYIPWVAGNGPRLTLYKDCMEGRGWVQVDKPAQASK